MDHEQQIKAWIRQDKNRMTALEMAAKLGLNDWCLAAGFVRNLIWDRLHQFEITTPLTDIDLIYFDKNAPSEEKDRDYENKLKSFSDHPWSVKNQARMHLRNNDTPYLSTADAMSYWVEVETAIGAHLSAEGEISLIAPFGLSSLFSHTITMNHKRKKPRAFQQRMQSKHWLSIWPMLKIGP